MPKKGKIEASEKAKIIREYLSDRMSMTEAARRAGVADSTIYAWVRMYKNDGVAGLMPQSKHIVYPLELKKAEEEVI